MNVLSDNPLWVEKYRPKTVQDTILSDELKKTFQTFVDQESVPNLILSGTAGVGKTTIARAMLEELECDYIIINGSMKGNIDTLRNEIQSFASSVSMSGGRKYVILDEADYLNGNSTQPAMRGFMDEFSKNCGFIFTCNYKNRIIEPLQSRCTVIDFKIKKTDVAKLSLQFMKRLCDILDKENVPYDKSVVAEVIKKHYPDWRKTLNDIQRYSAVGGIDSGILVNFQETSLNDLISLMKDKNFTGVRKWAGENVDADADILYRKIYDHASQHFTPQTIPAIVLIIGKYQYQHAFAADAEINLVCALTEIMLEAEFV